MASSDKQAIVPREKLDFGLEGDIPKYWFGGDAFKTRFFDAMSTSFPEGELFFIVSVREFRDRVSDPLLLEEVKHFIRQEGQHTMVHRQYNDRLKTQGIDVDSIDCRQRKLIEFTRRMHSKAFLLAMTASAEHMTAIMAHSFFARKEVFATADPRMRAMWAWHAMEEVEHKAVAFDVMQQGSDIGYARRVGAMLLNSLFFPFNIFGIMRYMLKQDGLSMWQRTKVWVKGLWWMYKPGGLFSPVLGHYLKYYKPGFHPWQEGEMGLYRRWLDTMNATRDPIAAGEAVHAAGV